MATYKEKADLISIGAYQPGSDPPIDAAIAARDPIDAFLKQGVTEPSSALGADATPGRARRPSAATFDAPVVDGQLVAAGGDPVMPARTGRHAAPQRASRRSTSPS